MKSLIKKISRAAYRGSKAKIVIFEGIDNSGKDTLINKFIEIRKSINPEIKIKVYHFTNPENFRKQTGFCLDKDDIYTQMYQFLNTYDEVQRKELDKYDYIIFNRSHLSEPVYGPLYRSDSYKGKDDFIVFKAIESALSELLKKAYLIYVKASPELSIKHDDGLSYSVNLENRKKELDIYSKVVRKSIIFNKLVLPNYRQNKKGEHKFVDIDILGIKIVRFVE